MHYGRIDVHHGYSKNSHSLAEVSEENDLGIIFQDDLKFNKHTSSKVQKANSLLGLIIRSFDYLDRDSYVRLYKDLVRPQLEYGNSVWHQYLRKHVESLETTQKRFTRTLPGFKEISYFERLKQLKLLL